MHSYKASLKYRKSYVGLWDASAASKCRQTRIYLANLFTSPDAAFVSASTVTSVKRRVLFICTGNTCRSQIAEALVNARLGEAWQAFSAGSRPEGAVNPFALRVLAEAGITHLGRSKSLDEFRQAQFDVVITLCDSAATECPTWLGGGRRVHVPFPDPAIARGVEAEVVAVYRAVRDDITRRILPLLQQWQP